MTAARSWWAVRWDQPLTVAFDALPGPERGGKVERSEDHGENQPGAITDTVAGALDKPDERLRWNMTAAVGMKTR